MFQLRAGIASTLAAAVVTMSATAAHACYDGYQADIGDVSMIAAGPADTPFIYSQAKELARWGVKLDALLPEGASLSLSPGGGFEYCSSVAGCKHESLQVWQDHGYSAGETLGGALSQVFDAVAQREGSSPATMRRARATQTGLYTVQVASFPWRARAELYAQSLNMKMNMGQLEWEPESFYTAGGFPALHDVASVVAANVAGKTVYRVAVGVFTDPAKAIAYRKRVAATGRAAAISVEWLR